MYSNKSKIYWSKLTSNERREAVQKILIWWRSIIAYRISCILPLPVEIWLMIGLYCYHTRLQIRQISHVYNNIQKRLPGPHCGYCKQETFIPVRLRFKWGWNLYEKDTNEFCSKINSIMCIRCARDYTHVCLQDNKTLKCLDDCCKVNLNNCPYRFKLSMAYGSWPRKPEDPAHKNKYIEMDYYGVGLTICPLCNEDCKTIMECVYHVRTVCRRH